MQRQSLGRDGAVHGASRACGLEKSARVLGPGVAVHKVPKGNLNKVPRPPPHSVGRRFSRFIGQNSD